MVGGGETGELIFEGDTAAPIVLKPFLSLSLSCTSALCSVHPSLGCECWVGSMLGDRKEDVCLLGPHACPSLRCLRTRSGSRVRKSCDTWECKCSLVPPRPPRLGGGGVGVGGGLELDGALGVDVADGVKVRVGLALTRPARAQAVLLLTEQGGGLPRAAVRPHGGRGLEGEGGGLRRRRNVGTRHRRARRGRRRHLGEGGVVTGGVRRWRHTLAGSAGGGGGGGGGGGHLGEGGAAARRRSAGNLAPRRRRGQQQGVAGPRRRDGRQGHGRVQAAAAALRGLRRAVQLGGQEAVLVLSTRDLREESGAAPLIG